jgi:EAL domain-containing protein (putative c-di-GMP-specific phosphodiesterase class I)
VDLKTGAILAAEALVRWRHPQRGLVPPAQFIPIAQDCGLMVSIGRWVLHEACRQARVWQQDPNLRPIRIAVNISTAELRNRDFVAAVRDTLTATGLAPRYLELELTESFLMQDASSRLRSCRPSSAWAYGSRSMTSVPVMRASPV